MVDTFFMAVTKYPEKQIKCCSVSEVQSIMAGWLLEQVGESRELGCRHKPGCGEFGLELEGDIKVQGLPEQANLASHIFYRRFYNLSQIASPVQTYVVVGEHFTCQP